MRGSTSYFAFALAFMSAQAWAQSIDSSFAKLSTSLDQVMESQERDLQAIRANIERLHAAAASLPIQSRADYAASLEAQSDLLARAAQEPDSAKRARLIADVGSDLDLKVRSRKLGASATLRGYVDVEVVPKRGGYPVNDLVVEANPLALADYASPLFRFSRMSSPTARPLPPGRYVFILRRGTKELSREIADIGGVSMEKVTLELPVPPE